MTVADMAVRTPRQAACDHQLTSSLHPRSDGLTFTGRLICECREAGATGSFQRSPKRHLISASNQNSFSTHGFQADTHARSMQRIHARTAIPSATLQPGLASPRSQYAPAQAGLQSPKTHLRAGDTMPYQSGMASPTPAPQLPFKSDPEAGWAAPADTTVSPAAGALSIDQQSDGYHHRHQRGIQSGLQHRYEFHAGRAPREQQPSPSLSAFPPAGQHPATATGRAGLRPPAPSAGLTEVGANDNAHLQQAIAPRSPLLTLPASTHAHTARQAAASRHHQQLPSQLHHPVPYPQQQLQPGAAGASIHTWPLTPEATKPASPTRFLSEHSAAQQRRLPDAGLTIAEVLAQQRMAMPATAPMPPSVKPPLPSQQPWPGDQTQSSQGLTVAEALAQERARALKGGHAADGQGNAPGSLQASAAAMTVQRLKEPTPTGADGASHADAVEAADDVRDHSRQTAPDVSQLAHVAHAAIDAQHHDRPAASAANAQQHGRHAAREEPESANTFTAAAHGQRHDRYPPPGQRASAGPPALAANGQRHDRCPAPEVHKASHLPIATADGQPHGNAGANHASRAGSVLPAPQQSHAAASSRGSTTANGSRVPLPQPPHWQGKADVPDAAVQERRVLKRRLVEASEQVPSQAGDLQIDMKLAVHIHTLPCPYAAQCNACNSEATKRTAERSIIK